METADAWTAKAPLPDPARSVDVADIIVHPEITCYNEAVCAEIALYGDTAGGPPKNHIIGYTSHRDVMVFPLARLGDGRYLLSSANLPLDFLGWDKPDLVEGISAATPGVEMFARINYAVRCTDYGMIREASGVVLHTSRLHENNFAHGVSLFFVCAELLTEVSVSACEIVAGPAKSAFRRSIADGEAIYRTRNGARDNATRAAKAYTFGEFIARFEPKKPLDPAAYIARVKKMTFCARSDASAKLD